MSIGGVELPRHLPTLLALVVGGYLAVVAVVYLLQSHLMYAPSAEMVATPAASGLAYEAMTFTSADGVQLSAWWVPAHEARETVLFCHGNGGNISHLVSRLELLNEMKLNAFVFDYRGYGESAGSPSEQGTYLDAAAAWEVLINQRGIRPGQVIVYGWSLGGAIAAHLVANLAAGEQPGRLILESTFTSVPDLAGDLYPYLPSRWLARFGYHTREYLLQTQCPVLIVHSREDELIPFTHGKRLLAAAGTRGRFLETNGIHAEGYSASEVAYRQALEDFLDTP